MRLKSTFAIIIIILTWAAAAPGAETAQDDLGRAIHWGSPPKRIVSLSPPATEILCALGAQGRLVGVSTEDEYFPELIGIPAAGVPAGGDLSRVLALRPDLVIIEPEAASALDRLEAAGVRVLAFGGGASLERGEERVRLLGRLTGKAKRAEEILSAQAELLSTLALKTAKVERRLTAARLIGRNGALSLPGAGSFQSQLVAAAGGLDPANLPRAEIVPLTPKLLSSLSPDFLYACAKDKASIESVLGSKAWRALSALRGQIRYFPCALTDRAAAHVGYFAAWLSSAMYPADYGRPENFVRKSGIVSERPLKLAYPHVASAKIIYAIQSDYLQKSLVIEFSSPQAIVSTASGAMRGATHVGNCSSPPMVWDIHHQGGWEADLAARFKMLGLDRKTTSLLFTGADMDNLAIKTVSYKDMSVTALVTAGAESNAVRTSKDVGAWYQPGTINVIILTSRALTEAGAAKALLVATEAKTAALWDLDIRSSQTPLINPATGT
ncbi:MAG: adenosylcobinamide amidohydrolase, partial [Deltaproteobacteria bacterium]|nr:adenosylcobinamide amidohydrolase [Deltaproteobacteria bacterium]